MPPKGKDRCKGLPPDILSDLHDNVIDAILMHLPCKDAVRTSVLSRKWRYHWCRLAKWKFDESLWSTQKDTLYPNVKFRKIVYQLLTHHEGPITQFKLYISYLKEYPKIENFIYFLSRKDIQHLFLHLPERLDELYKLPSSIFKCSQLRHLNIHNCSIQYPSACEGFDSLVSLELCRVSISSELLGNLISHSPLLEKLVLKILDTSNITEINAPMLRSFDFTGSISSISLKNVPLLAKVSLICENSSMALEKLNYAKFFQSCSALEHLLLNFQYCKFFADDAPTRLKCVKHFHLSHVVLEESYDLSCALCLIRSFPNLEYLKIEFLSAWMVLFSRMVDNEAGSGILGSLERFSDVSFNHLREVELLFFGKSMLEMQLIKILLAKSPVLVKMYINPAVRIDTGSEILAELVNFQHASPEAEIDIEDYGKLELNRVETDVDVVV